MEMAEVALAVAEGVDVKIPAVPDSNNPKMMSIIYKSFLSVVEAEKAALKWALKIQVVDQKSHDDAKQVLRDCKAAIEKLEKAENDGIGDLVAYIKTVHGTGKSFQSVFEVASDHVKSQVKAYTIKKEREANEERERLRAQEQELQRKQLADKQAREAEESKRQLEEAEKEREARAEADAKIAKVKNEDEKMRLELKAQEDEKARLAQLEKERAERDRINAEQEARDKADRELKQQQINNEIAKANALKETKGTSKRWTYDIEDEKAVIRRYCSPDKGIIRKAVNGGLRNFKEDGTLDPDAAGLRIYEDVSVITR